MLTTAARHSHASRPPTTPKQTRLSNNQPCGYIVCSEHQHVLLSAASCRLHGLTNNHRWLSLTRWLALYQPHSEQLALAYRCAQHWQGYLILQLRLPLSSHVLSLQHRLMSYRQGRQRLLIGSITCSSSQRL